MSCAADTNSVLQLVSALRCEKLRSIRLLASSGFLALITYTAGSVLDRLILSRVIVPFQTSKRNDLWSISYSAGIHALLVLSCVLPEALYFWCGTRSDSYIKFSPAN